MEEIEVTFEGRKRTVKVPDNFDKTNPNHQEQLKQHFWKQDSENKSGPLGEFLDVALEGVRAGTLDPAGSAFNIAEEEREAGQRAMKDAMSKFKAGQMSSAAFNALTGSMRWLFSPATGFGRAFAGDPVEAGTGMALEAVGVDPEIGVRDIPVVGESLADWGGDYQLKQFLGDTAALGTFHPSIEAQGLMVHQNAPIIPNKADMLELQKSYDDQEKIRQAQQNKLMELATMGDDRQATAPRPQMVGAGSGMRNFQPIASGPLKRPDDILNTPFLQGLY